MSAKMSTVEDLPSYDDEDGIQLMDSDANNLELEEQNEMKTEEKPISKTLVRQRITFDEIDQEQIEQEKRKYRSRFSSERYKAMGKNLMLDKVKLYIRDGPKSHHIENKSIANNYFNLPTDEELVLADLTTEKVEEIWKSLDLTKEHFRVDQPSSGIHRPESILIRGVRNMDTQKIFDSFEEFSPIGIEWVSDDSCNMFWNDTVSPLQLLSKISTPLIVTTDQQQTEEEERKASRKRKFNELSTSNNQTSNGSALPVGSWRKIELTSDEQSKPALHVRYSTIEDRKIIGSQKRSEYYREHGNPNFDNMTGFISRSKRRELNRLKSDPTWNFTVVKTTDDGSAATSVVEDTVPEDSQNDSNVKFTVILPTKKSESNDGNQNEADEDDDHERPSKRQRRRRSSEESQNNEEDQHTESSKTHFTVTIDSKSTPTKDLTSKSRNSASSSSQHDSSSNKRHSDYDRYKTPMADARQILERKRRSRV